MTDNNFEMKVPENLNESHHVHLGLILGILILALALILGGLFFWGSMINEQAEPTPEPVIVNNEPETPRAVADQQLFETLSPSDELDAIDADLSSTNLESLDTDIAAIDAELDAALPQ
jgi:hypothetical protein